MVFHAHSLEDESKYRKMYKIPFELTSQFNNLAHFTLEKSVFASAYLNRIIFIDNSINFTSSSLILKALDSLQKILINFSSELSRKNDYRSAKIDLIHELVSWSGLVQLPIGSRILVVG